MKEKVYNYLALNEEHKPVWSYKALSPEERIRHGSVYPVSLKDQNFEFCLYLCQRLLEYKYFTNKVIYYSHQYNSFFYRVLPIKNDYFELSNRDDNVKAKVKYHYENKLYSGPYRIGKIMEFNLLSYPKYEELRQSDQPIIDYLEFQKYLVLPIARNVVIDLALILLRNPVFLTPKLGLEGYEYGIHLDGLAKGGIESYNKVLKYVVLEIAKDLNKLFTEHEYYDRYFYGGGAKNGGYVGGANSGRADKHFSKRLSTLNSDRSNLGFKFSVDASKPHRLRISFGPVSGYLDFYIGGSNGTSFFQSVYYKHREYRTRHNFLLGIYVDELFTKLDVLIPFDCYDGFEYPKGSPYCMRQQYYFPQEDLIDANYSIYTYDSFDIFKRLEDELHREMDLKGLFEIVEHTRWPLLPYEKNELIEAAAVSKAVYTFPDNA
jgi:hypothetical protein